MRLTLEAVMTKEPIYTADIPPALADLIKLCLIKDYHTRIDIKEVIHHNYFLKSAEKEKEKKKAPTLVSSQALKLGVAISSGKFKRTASQSNQRSPLAAQLSLSKGKSVDKRDRDVSSEQNYNSLLKDLSKLSMINDEKPRLIRTANMQPCSYSTKNGKISILKDGTVEVDLSAKKKKIIKISQDGASVVFLS